MIWDEADAATLLSEMCKGDVDRDTLTDMFDNWGRRKAQRKAERPADHPLWITTKDKQRMVERMDMGK